VSRVQAAHRKVPTVVAEVRSRVEGKQASVDGQGRVDVAVVTG